MERFIGVLTEVGRQITVDLPNQDVDTTTMLTNILSWVFGLTGILAVVMIIVSGFQMSMSAGDAGAVTKAKNTLIYSVVGLVVSLFAFAIVTFVVGKVG
ncbi:hypothetical protein IJH89_00155 [Candidatus Saccharibacteria bacterium]|nr:hypothetical protein [Candidatus Saccharibacteria bacterium]